MVISHTLPFTLFSTWHAFYGRIGLVALIRHAKGEREELTRVAIDAVGFSKIA